MKFGELFQAYTLKHYFDLLETDTRRVNISTVFNAFKAFNKEKQNYYHLLSINVTRNVVYGEILYMSEEQRQKVSIEFLTDLYAEVRADLHVRTLTLNWCRLLDEVRLVFGKTIPLYTLEKKYLSDWQRKTFSL